MRVPWLVVTLALVTGPTVAAAAEPEPPPVPIMEPAPAEPPPVPVMEPAAPEPPMPAPAPKLVVKKAPRPDCPPRFSISLGAGAGLPIGASADRVDAGLHAAVDVRWYPHPTWSLWLQTTLSLLPLVEGLPVEPGGGSSVTAFTVVVGAEARQEVAPDLELTLALGVGLGGFGLAAADEALGWAFDASVGARYRLDSSLAVRLDFAPVAIIPLDADQSIGGHLAIVLRGEASF